MRIIILLLAHVAVWSVMIYLPLACSKPAARLDYAADPQDQPDTAIQRRLQRSLDSVDSMPRHFLDPRPPGAP